MSKISPIADYYSDSTNATGVEWSGWKLSLARASENSIDLSPYEDFIQDTMASEGISGKVFPVIFHVIYDDISLLSPDPSTNKIQFEAKVLLDSINNKFKDTNISFRGADYGEDGTLLSSPGINLIDGGLIESTRPNGDTYTYAKDFVHLTGKNDGQVSRGVPLAALYTEHQWDPFRYLNIFIVTRVITHPDSGRDISYMPVVSENPYIAQVTNLPHMFNSTVPFYALGAEWESEKSQGFKYKYVTGSKVLDTFTNVFPHTVGFRADGRVLTQALGHMLGLSLTTVHGAGGVCPSSECVYNDLYNKSAAGDCCPDTYNVNTNSHIWPEMYTNAICGEQESHATVYNNFMTLSAFSGFQGSAEGNLANRFTSSQIKRMHANCTMLIKDKNGVTKPGFLLSILSSTGSTLIPLTEDVDLPCGVEVNDGTIVGDLEIVLGGHLGGKDPSKPATDPRGGSSLGRTEEVTDQGSSISSSFKTSADFERIKIKITTIVSKYV